MPCAIDHQLPAVYYLAARFSDDFESAVMHALNGGGQNKARGILTGALAGAQVGFSGIPQRFLDGLDKSSELTVLAQQLGEQMARRPAISFPCLRTAIFNAKGAEDGKSAEELSVKEALSFPPQRLLR